MHTIRDVVEARWPGRTSRPTAGVFTVDHMVRWGFISDTTAKKLQAANIISIDRACQFAPAELAELTGIHEAEAGAIARLALAHGYRVAEPRHRDPETRELLTTKDALRLRLADIAATE